MEDSGASGNNKAHVLVVDDTLLNLKVLTDILVKEGYAVNPVTSAQQALCYLDDKVPDIILLDVLMPEMDGYELCRLIKSEPATSDIPVIFISALDDVTDKIKGFQAGGVDYISKPFEARETLARVDTHLRLFRLQKQFERKNLQLQEEIVRRRRTENELRRVNTQFESLFNAIPFLLINLSRDGTVTKWNPAAGAILAISKEKAEGRNLKSLSISWDWEKLWPGVLNCQNSSATQCLEDIKYFRPDGSERLLEISIVPIPKKDDYSEGVIILGSDITEKRQEESLAIQMQKMESIGQLAAGIAHEINTPLQFISDNMHFLNHAFTQMVERPSVGQERAEEEAYLIKEIPLAIQDSLTGIERVAKIIVALKEFSSPVMHDKSLVDVNQAIQTILTVSSTVWSNVTEISSCLEDTLPRVMCNQGEISQALFNLLVNAVHAISVKNLQTPSHEGLIAITTGHSSGMVYISVKDNGIGISENIRNRIFDPFFTTKDIGEGIGQGLTITRAIITQNHKGKLTFASEEGAGSEFTIQLPYEAN